MIIDPYIYTSTQFDNTYSLDFDGTDDKVVFGNTIDLGTTSSESIWIKQSTPAAPENIIGIPVLTTLYHLHLDTASNGAYVRNASYFWFFNSAATQAALNTTDWIHIAIIRTGVTTCRFYVNGVDNDGIQTNASMVGNTLVACLGSSLYGGYWYQGLIDEYACFDEVKAIGDLWDGTGKPTNLAAESGLVAWYRMGDFGTYFNGNWEIPEQTKIDNFSSHCFDFDGIDDFISTVTLTDLGMAATNTMTVSFWVNFDTLALYDTIMGATTTTLPTYGDGFGFWIHSSGVGNPIYFFINDNVTQANSSPTITNTGEWYHVVGVYDGTLVSDNIKLYINGSVQSNTGTLTANITGVTRTINIGKIYRNVENCDGKIDNVSIWSVALDDHTVNSIYNAGKPNDLTLAASYTTGSGTDKSGDLQGYWRIGEGSTWDGGTSKWTIPDASTNSNTGTSQNMDEEDKINFAPDNENQGLSDGMGEDAPSGRDPDVP